MFYSNNFKNLEEIQHCFFSRKNGNSKGIYESLNCGIGSKDDSKNVYKNLFVEKIISQSQFLQKMGILERTKMISHKMDYKRKIDLYSRIQRLISPYMMGETFKIILARNLQLTHLRPSCLLLLL